MQSESFTITDHWTSVIGITKLNAMLNARTIWDGEDQFARLHISRHIAAYPSSDFRRGLSDGTNFTAIMARNPAQQICAGRGMCRRSQTHHQRASRTTCATSANRMSRVISLTM